MAKIRVFIADDHALIRSGLRMLINSQPDMETVGEAGTFPTTVDQTTAIRPDVLTLDLSMPGAQGLSGIEKLRNAIPTMKIVVVTMHDDPAYLRSALALGATGYVVKSAADSELISAIRAVYQGRVFVDVMNAEVVQQAVGTKVGKGVAPIDTLSAREREVLMLVAKGHTNQIVADQLSLSVKTVESYRARLMEKLGLANRADLTRLAIESGLLKSGPDVPTT